MALICNRRPVTSIVFALFTAVTVLQHTTGEECSANCDTGCSSKGPGSCDRCQSGYGLDDPQSGQPRACAPCDPNCDTVCYLSGAKKCDGRCKSGYTFNGSTKKCDGGSGAAQPPSGPAPLALPSTTMPPPTTPQGPTTPNNPGNGGSSPAGSCSTTTGAQLLCLIVVIVLI
jgi:hypothetical protein